MRQPEVRVALWRAVRELAQGLSQLHQQQMLHRALSADAILLDATVGPESMRLGGFEWTVKVGQDLGHSQDSLLSAPESSRPTQTPHTFESDWYQFGHVMAQMLAGADNASADDTPRHAAALAKVRDATKLTDLERDFLFALLEPKPELRLSRGSDIIRTIEEIIGRLDQPARFVENSYLGLAVLLGPNSRLTESICDIDDSISAIDTEAQRLFIQRDLETPRLIARPGSQGGTYLLQGNRLVYFLKEYAEPGSQPSGQWELAFSDGPGEIRYSSGNDSQVEIRRVGVRVFRVGDIRTDPTIVTKGAVSWRPFLPRGTSGLSRSNCKHTFDVRLVCRLKLSRLS
jgi:serine/threonine protein kinase